MPIKRFHTAPHTHIAACFAAAAAIKAVRQQETMKNERKKKHHRKINLEQKPELSHVYIKARALRFDPIVFNCNTAISSNLFSFQFFQSF